MTLYAEYYEVKTVDGYEYYFMPVDKDSTNKENIDAKCRRIWKYNLRTERVTEVKNITKDLPPVSKQEFFKIQILAKPLSYSDWYERRQEIERLKGNANKKPSSVD